MAFPVFAVVGIPVIFVLGFAGALLPSLVSFFFPSYGITRRIYFSFFNGLAAGLILAVGFVHSIPDSFESFDEVMEQSDASEMTRDYAWPAWIAMMGVIICFSVEELVDFLAAHFRVAHAHSHAHSHKKGEPALVEDDEEDDIEAKKELAEKESTDEGVQNSKSEKTKKEKTSKDYTPATRRMVKMLVLFFGLLFHNIFVGLALGTADNDHALFIAIIFHQFFEGLGLGSRVADVDMRKILSVLLIDFVFAASAPVGIGIGLGVKSALEDGSMAYSTVDGTFQALTPSAHVTFPNSLATMY
ncbi:metal cation transporter, ZIP family protein [Acanthamoeba castellanii str. Neff]|uniref:Metal cation transporter, ZIP family protein n=1 Tax=Acanthamoeba castellanii (strain ATCC 30010 / Neff) TaxID=1257118 RepID=L8HCU3_ACACF|nr:metal cation transporter, ZIP family protein [Acanthamoeba castellanii str. Neff]ELR23369.1 metal cation transporter, ZIP family protein [Acanthamoeba castellanii str. Neff]